MRRNRFSKSSFCSWIAIVAQLGFIGARAESASPEASHCVSCFKGLPVALDEIPGSNPLMKVLRGALFYTDATGTVWKANAGDKTDGASIPDVFVPVIGDRFEPDFLPAAIIHDHYATDEHKVRPWTDTARVFYEAMITNETQVVKAKVMYYAVYVFGPHWGKLKPGQYCGPICINVAPHKFTIESDGGDRILQDVEPLADGEQFFIEPPHATPSDVVEVQQIKAMIEAGEAFGDPMSLYELDRQASLRHRENVFIAIAATRQ